MNRPHYKGLYRAALKSAEELQHRLNHYGDTEESLIRALSLNMCLAPSNDTGTIRHYLTEHAARVGVKHATLWYALCAVSQDAEAYKHGTMSLGFAEGIADGRSAPGGTPVATRAWLDELVHVAEQMRDRDGGTL